jgi:hypothetical protein
MWMPSVRSEPVPMPDSVVRRLITDNTTTLTPRQRLFCARVAGGATGAEAARQAGYSTHSAAQQASRLLGQDMIRRKIASLNADAATARQAALDRMLNKVEQVYTHAIRQRQCAAALRAIEVEGVLRQNGARSLPIDLLPDDLEPDPSNSTEIP